MVTTVPLFGALPGTPEMLVILLVLVLLFGANKIPKLAKSTGQAMGEFQKGRQEVEQELEEMQESATLDENEDSASLGETEPDTVAEPETESEEATND